MSDIGMSGAAREGVASVGGGVVGGSQEKITIVQITPQATDVKLAMDFNKLKGQSNFIYWSDNAKSALEYLGLWEYATGEVAKPSLLFPISRDAWSKNDKKALFLIKNRIEESLHSRIRLCNTSSELWEKLQDMFKLKGSAGKQSAWENWERVKLKEGGDVSLYLAEHDSARSVVEELGTRIDGDFAALRLLIGLPPSWGVFRSTVEAGTADRDEQLNYDKIYRLISQEDNR